MPVTRWPSCRLPMIALRYPGKMPSARREQERVVLSDVHEVDDKGEVAIDRG